MINKWRQHRALAEFAGHDRDSLLAVLAGTPRLLSRPWFQRAWLRWLLEACPVADVFELIYAKNLWGTDESRSGAGSTLTETASIRDALPGILDQLAIRSLLDIPCGDFNWMRQVNLDGIEYIGADVVHDLVAANNMACGDSKRRFERLDVISDRLPKMDAVLCRDCLVHLSTEDGKRALANIRDSGATYLLATTFPTVQKNVNILTGYWRHLSQVRLPLTSSASLILLHEGNPDPLYADKSLGVWRIADMEDDAS